MPTEIKDYKSLFNKYNAFSYNTPGGKCEEEFHKLFQPFWEKWTKAGYNPREVSHIIQASVACTESETVLRNAMLLKKEEKTNGNRD
ncbi:MAG: hypothetical protein WDA06_00915 [Phenylobacterium sp.]